MNQELFEKYAGLAMQSLITCGKSNAEDVANLSVMFAKALVDKVEGQSSEITLKIYKDSPEAKEYLIAKFARNSSSIGIFKYKDSFWKYRHTHFDKNGEYDLIFQPKE